LAALGLALKKSITVVGAFDPPPSLGRIPPIQFTRQQRKFAMQKITPFLWFDNEAEEAARFYCSIFKNSTVGTIARYGDAGPGPKGSVMTVAFELDGQQFTALNGGPHFKFTEAVSFVVNCKDQAEVDELWDKLSQGGEKSRCGWLKDKYGLSWQVVPIALMELINDPDPEKSKRVVEAMLQMTKIDVAKLKAAHAG
jgi:predicted 3-demethylubiquinone-9 3-methyltransferase (glyoxalase superfamily)